MVQKPQNLLLLTIDAWRADFVDSFAGVPLTPSLSRLASRSVRFQNAYANAPWTSPGLISLFTGIDPFRHGVHYEWSAPPPGGPALAAQLAAAGYRVPNICYLNRVGNYQNLGYSVETAPDYPKNADDDLLVRTLRQLDDSEPWFLWYHYKFVHLPYFATRAHRQLFDIDDATLPARLRESVCSRFVVPRQEFSLLREDQPLVQRLYAAGVRQMDDFVGRVIDELSRGNRLDHTTLVVTADHGDELLEHGHVGHASTAHYATLYEEVLRIPLLIADPRVAAPKTVAARVQGIDLYPTLLSLCGQQQPGLPDGAVDLSPLVLQGREPAELTRNRVFFFQSSRMGYQTPRSYEGQLVSAFSDGSHKYICEEYDGERRLLFDLENDRAEQHPLTAGPQVDAAHKQLLSYRSGR